jgi:hypothetical protein
MYDIQTSMRDLTELILVAMIIAFFPAHATISTSLDVAGDADSQMRIIEASEKGLIDITTYGNMSLLTTKSITDDHSEGAAGLMADTVKFKLRTPEYSVTMAGNVVDLDAVYGFVIVPKEVTITDTQDNSTTILTTTVNEAQAAVSLDASIQSNVSASERINVPYKNRPLTIGEFNQNGGGLIFNRTLELSGLDIWRGDKI